MKSDYEYQIDIMTNKIKQLQDQVDVGEVCANYKAIKFTLHLLGQDRQQGAN